MRGQAADQRPAAVIQSMIPTWQDEELIYVSTLLWLCMAVRGGHVGRGVPADAIGARPTQRCW